MAIIEIVNFGKVKYRKAFTELIDLLNSVGVLLYQLILKC
jgi:hypothetical protein